MLGAMLTLPRLLTLPARHLSKLDELYEGHEIAFIKARIKQEAYMPTVPALFQEHLELMARMRPTKAKGNSHSANLSRKMFKKDLMLNIFSIIALVID